MPTLWAHDKYFNNASTVVAPTLAPSKGGYPLWQASGTSVGSLFGPLQAAWDWCVWWAVVVWRIVRLPRLGRDRLVDVLDTLAHPPVTPQTVSQPGIVHRRLAPPTIHPYAARPRILRRWAVSRWIWPDPTVQPRKARRRVGTLLKWAREARRADPPPIVVARAESILDHPAYPFAQAAVRKTATTLGFNRPEAWQGLSRHMKSSPGIAENVYRHLNACQLTRETAGSTLTNPECNLLVELAYHDYALRNK